VDPSRLARDVKEAFSRNELLLYASAISFRVFFAIIPLLLFTFGALGFLHLGEVWRDDIAPDIKPDMSQAAFQVVDDTISNVLGREQFFWATLGAAIAVWQISGAMRMIIKASNRIYDVRERRPVVRVFAVSIALGIAAAILVLGAVALIEFGGPLVEELFGKGTLLGALAFVVRWVFAVALLLLLVGLVVRFAPAKRRPLEWVSFGAVVVVAAWIVMSLGFDFYLTTLANYGSVFGNLATVIIAIEYVFLSSIVFVSGIQIDALTRREAER
jgi:membrane protein